MLLRLIVCARFASSRRMSVVVNAGDMDLNPDTGEYRFMATVPEVEVNALRETLGVRPLPFPLAGSLRGTLFCTGPLEEPSFSGAVTTDPHHALTHRLHADCPACLMAPPWHTVVLLLRTYAKGLKLAEECTCILLPSDPKQSTHVQAWRRP